MSREMSIFRELLSKPGREDRLERRLNLRDGQRVSGPTSDPRKAVMIFAIALGLFLSSSTVLAISVDGEWLSGTAELGEDRVLGPFLRIETVKYTGSHRPGPDGLHFEVKWFEDGVLKRTTQHDIYFKQKSALLGVRLKHNLSPGESLPNERVYVTGMSGGGGVKLYFSFLDFRKFDIDEASVSAHWTIDGEPLGIPVP